MTPPWKRFCIRQVTEKQIDNKSQVLFIGLSLGGSIAQMTAYRMALRYPSIANCIHVLALGPLQWATPPLVDAFSAVFNDRAVQLVSCLKCKGMPREGIGWWVPIAQDDAELMGLRTPSRRNSRDTLPGMEPVDTAAMEADGGRVASPRLLSMLLRRERSESTRCRRSSGSNSSGAESSSPLQLRPQWFLVIDPLASSFVDSFQMMRNILLCSIDPSGNVHRCGLQVHGTEYCFRSRCTERHLSDFLSSKCVSLQLSF